MTTQSSSLRLANQLVEQPYAWPGGYPMFAITSDGAALCKECCKNEKSCIGTTTGSDGWNLIALDINYEDKELYCDHCSTQIEYAYE